MGKNSKKRVVITGAAGYVAQRMIQTLRERYELVPLDIRAESRTGIPLPDIMGCDLTVEDRETFRHHFTGADSVIHLGIADIKGLSRQARRENDEANFASNLRNMRMAYNVYQTALEENVRRVIVASSVHATDHMMDLAAEELVESVTPAH